MLMRYSLSNGAASTGVLAVIGGGTTIVTTNADLWGWAAIVVGLFVWAWAFSVDGEQWRSIAVCLQFSNHDKGAKTLRNIEAWLTLGNDLIPLAIRDGKKDLRDGEIALVELGRVTEPVTGDRQHLGVVKFKPFHVEENVGIYLKRPTEHRTLYVGTSETRVGLHDNVVFRVKSYSPEKANAQ